MHLHHAGGTQGPLGPEKSGGALSAPKTFRSSLLYPTGLASSGSHYPQPILFLGIYAFNLICDHLSVVWRPRGICGVRLAGLLGE